MTDLKKRRTLTLLACAGSAAAVAGFPFAGLASTLRSASVHRWHGTALGAQATILLDGTDKEHADQVLADIVVEIDRLENIFSLYRPASTLSRLNTQGEVGDPEQEFIDLMARATGFAALTNGAFDPTIQPVWQALAGLSLHKTTDRGQIDAVVAHSLQAVGYRDLVVEEGRVSFARRGMAVTLNGIAQGYITDRIAALLRQRGFNHVLVDLGEQRAVGPQADGANWRVRIKAPISGQPAREAVDLGTDALATSGTYGFRFDLPGQRFHLIDPKNGTSPALWSSLSVQAPSATTADALSTAFSMMSEHEIRKVLPLTDVSLVIGFPHAATDAANATNVLTGAGVMPRRIVGAGRRDPSQI
ncbi:FAD:protein FMN transferase [Thalassospira mesophila]|uniref:FAD:protein FMN transferase n=1 Tax=Thalassospira mesophila TaxID=1293891 RepID=UPI000A1F93BD|nr:FAD:protein FMN transferase [Thalassospira mesophila]